MSVLVDLRRGWTLPGDSLAIAWSEHAVARYGQRVRPALDPAVLRRELSALLTSARVTRECPDWLTSDDRANAFLVLTDEIAAPLYAHDGELIAATVVFRSMIEGERRQRRTAATRRRRAGKRSATRVKKRHGRRDAPRAPDAAEWDV